MAQTNAILKKTGQITIDPGASGDAFIQSAINGTDKWRYGVDDTDSDAFIIAQGSALGTTNAFRMSADGMRTMSAQPSFLNTLNTENDVTGDGTQHRVGSVTATTSVFDRGGNMTEGDGAGTPAIFTAPVDGIYLFTVSYTVFSDATSGINVAYVIWTSPNPPPWVGPNQNNVTGFYGSSTNTITKNGSAFFQLTASDTVEFGPIVSGSGGSKTSDVTGGFICGMLLA